MASCVELRNGPIVVALLCLSLFPGPAPGAMAAGDETVLANMSLEELLQVEVTSVSRHEEPIGTAAAAVFVLTNEDLRRSGVSSLPDALRLVPGVQVARISANTFAITSRGFNSRFANKLLVLIDGRSIYTPSFSGVFWDQHNLLLEDVDRIEVIRGPGGALWGANAMNGVINIITKNSEETQGYYAEAGAGNQEELFGAFRTGGAMGEATTWRISGYGFEREPLPGLSGLTGTDDWKELRADFRSDTTLSNGDSLSIQAGVSDGSSGGVYEDFFPSPPFVTSIPFEGDSSGYHLQGEWKHSASDKTGMNVRAAASREEKDLGFILTDSRILNLELERWNRVGTRQFMVWGAGYRHIDDRYDVRASTMIGTDPSLSRWNLFFQDEIQLLDGQARLILGAKVEDSQLVGISFVPNVRFAWQYSDTGFLWTAVSTAVKTPNRQSQNITLNVGVDPNTGTLVRLIPNTDLQEEELVAMEAGWRIHTGNWFVFELALFDNHYREAEGINPETPFFEPVPAPPHAVLPVRFINGFDIQTHGGEVNADIRVSDHTRLRLAYSWIRMRTEENEQATSASPRDLTEDTPTQQATVWLSKQFGPSFSLDAIIRYVDKLPASDHQTRVRPQIDAYTELDLNLTWIVNSNLTLNLVGRDLLNSSHLEFIDSQLPSPAAEIERSWYIKASFRY